MGDNKVILDKILNELLSSKELNKELFNEIKISLKEFEDEVSRLSEKQNLDKDEIKNLIFKVEKDLEDKVSKIERESLLKMSNLEKKVLEVELKSTENTKDHAENKSNLNKFVFAIITAFIGLIVYTIKGG